MKEEGRWAELKAACERIMTDWPDFRMAQAVEDMYQAALDKLAGQKLKANARIKRRKATTELNHEVRHEGGITLRGPSRTPVVFFASCRRPSPPE